MMQGTTPKHIFAIPFDTSMVATCQVLYAQNDTVIITKDTEDCELDGKNIITHLTQKETFSFDHNVNVNIQIRVLTTGGDSLVSDIITVDVGRCLNEQVLL